MNQVRVKVKFYKKSHPKKGSWEQAVLYVRAEDKEKLKQFDGEEITLYLNPNGSTQIDDTKLELLKALLLLFNKAFRDEKIGDILRAYPETQQILNLIKKLRGENQ